MVYHLVRSRNIEILIYQHGILNLPFAGKTPSLGILLSGAWLLGKRANLGLQQVIPLYCIPLTFVIMNWCLKCWTHLDTKNVALHRSGYWWTQGWLTFGMVGLFLSSACSANPFFRSEVGIKGGLLSLHTHVTSCLTSLYATWGPSYHVGKVPRREAESHKSGALLLEGLDKNVEAMSRLWLPTRSKQKEVNPHKLV